MKQPTEPAYCSTISFRGEAIGTLQIKQQFKLLICSKIITTIEFKIYSTKTANFDLPRQDNFGKILVKNN